jgi:hypothetical protein
VFLKPISSELDIKVKKIAVENKAGTSSTVPTCIDGDGEVPRIGAFEVQMVFV